MSAPEKLTRIGNLFRVLKHNGGIWGTLGKVYRMDALKWGKLVGVDKFGNKYYQNDFYFYGRNRWVEYDRRVHLEYDGSMVPAEWHNWLHYICDDPPTLNPRVQYKWMIDHTENLTGSNKCYVPYSTMPPKIHSWNPPGTDLKIGSIKTNQIKDV